MDLFRFDQDSGFSFKTDSQKDETNLKWIRIAETALTNTFLFSFRFKTKSKPNREKLNLVSDSVNLASDSVTNRICLMTHWIESAELSVATKKTNNAVCVLSLVQSPSFQWEEGVMSLCTILKYLRLWFGGKLTFKEHAKRTAVKAEKIVVGIGLLMSNLGSRARVSVSCW